MAMDNIHVQQADMSTAVNRSSDVQTAIMDYEKQLTRIADLVKENWGGRAKEAFDKKHMEIAGLIGINAQEAGLISDGTNQALNISVGGDDEAFAVINAIQGGHGAGTASV
jgi:hypothetical protein